VKTKIEVGTMVFASWIDGSSVTGELVKRPQDVGDTFGVRLSDGDGRIFEWNPNCSNFDSMGEIPEP